MTTTRFASPVFSVSCVRGSSIPEDDFGSSACDALVAVASGGGSARSGIPNTVTLLQVDVKGADSGKPVPFISETPVATFNTGRRLVTQLDVSVSKRRFVACTVDAATWMLEIVNDDGVKKNSVDKKEKEGKEATSGDGKKDVDGSSGDASSASGEKSTASRRRLKIVSVLETTTDESESEPAQNIVRFSRLQPHRFAAGGNDGILRVFDIEGDDGSDPDDAATSVKVVLACEFKRHTKEIKDLTFHPANENIVVSVSIDATCRVWSLSTMSMLQMLPADTARNMTYRGCRFSADGMSLLTLQNPSRRGASYLVVWRQRAVAAAEGVKNSADSETTATSAEKEKPIGARGTFLVHSAVKIANVPSTGIDASADGRAIAISDCSGALSILDQTSYRFIGKNPKCHALPITGLTFLGSESSGMILSSHIATCSMDKSCGVVCVPAPRSSVLVTIVYIVLLLAVAVGVLFLTAYLACADEVDTDDIFNIYVCAIIRKT